MSHGVVLLHPDQLVVLYIRVSLALCQNKHNALEKARLGN